MGYKATVQMLQQAESLKSKVLRKCDLLTDTQSWTDQQSLQNIYHEALVSDLEYSLDQKVEQDLWNVAFKHHITSLQEVIRDKKNPKRSDYQFLLTWCLESASGFYISLLHELCNAFDIDLAFRRRGNVYGQRNSPELNNLPQSASCLYICQYCLVHLGDIARYRNQRRQAESFYKQAIMVSPTSGHPYNQLALLEASRGDKLAAVFYYIRSITVKNPFPAASTNVLNVLNTTVDKESPLEKVHSKITGNEFIQMFLCTHALINQVQDLEQAELGVDSLNATMTALVATQSFTLEKLLQITAINLYALKNVAENERAHRCVLDLLAGSMNAFLIPVHTLKIDENLLDYYALPAVKLLTYWIRNEPQVLSNAVFKNRLQIWPSLCRLLNNIQGFLKKVDYEQCSKASLLEDRLLQGFRPLSRNFKELDFNDDLNDEQLERSIRGKRLIDFGLFIGGLDVDDSKLITTSEKDGEITFEPGCIQPDPITDLLEELKSFQMVDKSNVKEKRGGILKPQGSLEKSREEREQMNECLNDPNNQSDCKKGVKMAKRTKQNVAIQSIFKKLEENKQVKFNVTDEPKERDKNTSNDSSESSPNNQSNQFRTQSYNQNHPAFPPPPTASTNQSEYMRGALPTPPTFRLPNTDVPPPNLHVPPPNIRPSYTNPMFGGAPKPPTFPQPPPPFHFENMRQSWFPPAPPPPPPPNQNYFAANQNRGSGGGDVLAANWGNFTTGGNFDSGVSMRQAMLKETHLGNNSGLQDSFNTPGYSLFNANSWTPNLAGQLRNNKPENSFNRLPQHSLFTGQGPQSLAQLLEQQQSHQKRDF